MSEKEKIISINGRDYNYNDLRQDISKWGTENGSKYKHWTKEGTYAIKDAFDLLDEMSDGTLEYNGSYFVDHSSKGDRNDKKRTLKSNTNRGNSVNAGAFVLASVINSASPITKGTLKDFLSYIYDKLVGELGTKEDFLDLDYTETDTRPVTNRYSAVTSFFNNILTNWNSYKNKYDIEDDYYNKIIAAKDAFADNTIDHNEMNLLNKLFNPKSIISRDYFKTDFSTSIENPAIENPAIENPVKGETPKPVDIEEDDSDSWIDEKFPNNGTVNVKTIKNSLSKKKLEEFKRNTSKVKDLYFINALIALLNNDENKKKELFKNWTGISDDEKFLLIIRECINRKLVKTKDSKNYIPTILTKNGRILQLTMNGKESILLKYVPLITLTGFKDHLKKCKKDTPIKDILNDYFS